MSNNRQVWRFSVVIEASEEDAERVGEAIARALCPDDFHPGPCPIPWTMMHCRFNELDDDEQRRWEADFDDERREWSDDAAPTGHRESTSNGETGRTV